MKKLLILLVVFGLVGCAAPKQTLTVFTNVPSKVCIVRHDAVKYPAFLNGMKKGFEHNHTNVRVIQGMYTLENNVWHPTYLNDEIIGCDKLVFYVANWSWDLVMYLRYANIWVQDVGLNGGIITAQTIYSVEGKSGLNLSKYNSDEAKATEMINNLYK